MQGAASSDGRAVAGRPAARARVALPALAGHVLEFYDFTLYALFAGVIARQFFPAGSAAASLMLALGTYAAGYLARPLGGWWRGRLADRHGCRRALVAATAMMGLGTMLIALTPAYASLGLAAPLLVLLGRLLQGLSAGGEVGATSVLLYQVAPPSRHGFMVSWQVVGQGGAALAGGVAVALVHLALPVEQVEGWGWRLPFLAGLLAMPLVLWWRWRMPDIPPPPADAGGRMPPAWTGLARRVALGVGLSIASTVLMQLLTYYLPFHLAHTLGYTGAFPLLVTCAIGAAAIVVAPLAGRLADRVRRQKRLLALSIALPLLAMHPVFVLLNAGHGHWLPVLLVTGMATLSFLGAGAGYVLLIRAFPPACRATAVALVYSLCVTLFGGGTTLLAVTWLVEWSGNPMAPAWYAEAACVVSLLALAAFPEERRSAP